MVKGPTRTLAKVAMKEQGMVAKEQGMVAQEQEMVAKGGQMAVKEQETAAKEKMFVPLPGLMADPNSSSKSVIKPLRILV
jgi:hypothetical protein